MKGRFRGAISTGRCNTPVRPGVWTTVTLLLGTAARHASRRDDGVFLHLRDQPGRYEFFTGLRHARDVRPKVLPVVVAWNRPFAEHPSAFVTLPVSDIGLRRHYQRDIVIVVVVDKVSKVGINEFV